MPGKQITKQQEKIYMSSRKSGNSQSLSAAKAGISERSGRLIEQGKRKPAKQHEWRTRKDPFAAVWASELVPMLEQSPELLPITLLEYLQEKYGSEYPDSKLRSLERRVKLWRAQYGPNREVMFRQEHPPGRQGLSDFTHLKGVVITISGVLYKHILYHFRLACSGWSHVKAIEGGESFTALAEGLQEALWRLGGVPFEHRTDSLSAAFKNLSDSEQEDITQRYTALCQHYGMIATRNNRGVSHENGSIESPHGHIKRRIKQALLLRGSNDFASKQAYQEWLDCVINQHNRRNTKNIAAERLALQPLPTYKTADFTEVPARVSMSSTIDVRRVTYTVPSRLEGECLRVHLYHDRLECFLGATHIVILSRAYPTGKTNRARNIDYRHVIHSLIKKPQAFRFSALRDDLLPTETYRKIWAHVEKNIRGKAACKLIVGLLHLATVHDCEKELGDTVMSLIANNKPLSLPALQQQFAKEQQQVPLIEVNQHSLGSYSELTVDKEAVHG